MAKFDERKYVYVMQPTSCYGTRIVNYDADNEEVNFFLSRFHIWGNASCGERKKSVVRCFNTDFEEVWYEMPKEMYNIINTLPFKLAFEKMGVKLTFDFPYKEELDRQ